MQHGLLPDTLSPEALQTISSNNGDMPPHLQKDHAHTLQILTRQLKTINTWN